MYFQDGEDLYESEPDAGEIRCGTLYLARFCALSLSLFF